MLQSYLDEMGKFLLYRDDTTGKLCRVDPEPDVQAVLRARTLAVLDSLVVPTGVNPDELEPFLRRKSLDRKRSLLQFLHEAGFIRKNVAIVRLEGANLREAYLRMVVLREADLKGADLGEADLAYADFSGDELSGASMGNAYLRGANLEGAILKDADMHDVNTILPADQQQDGGLESPDVDLKNADLTNANLRGADLRGSDLTGAKLGGAELDPADLRDAVVANDQLAQCWELAGTRMPDGSSYEWSVVQPGLTELLKNVSFPARKQDLIGRAQSQNCSRSLILALMRLDDNVVFPGKRELEERIEDETTKIALDVAVSVDCSTEPERTTVTNYTNGQIVLKKITSVHQPGTGEPVALDHTLEPGVSKTYESGPKAMENVLLHRAMYDNQAGRQEGAIVYTSVGRCYYRC
jgi:uncharacterized protein YjbI with pentapeptide repeats